MIAIVIDGNTSLTTPQIQALLSISLFPPFRTARFLSAFEWISKQDGLTRFLQSVFAESEFLVDSDAAAKGLFVQVFVQKVEFLIGRIGMEKYRLTELACSSVMAEVMQMARVRPGRL